MQNILPCYHSAVLLSAQMLHTTLGLTALKYFARSTTISTKEKRGRIVDYAEVVFILFSGQYCNKRRAKTAEQNVLESLFP